MPENRPLRVFLCHSSNDKPTVRELYRNLYREIYFACGVLPQKVGAT